MLTRDEEAQLTGWLIDRRSAYRRAADLLNSAADALIKRHYGCALSDILLAENGIGHNVITQPEREALRDMQREASVSAAVADSTAD
jgi:hypothetical protein